MILSQLTPTVATAVPVAASAPPKRYGAKKLTFDADAAALSTAEHVLFAAVGDCYDAWRRVNGDATEGDGESFAADEVLGSLVFTRDAKYHERPKGLVAK